MNPTNTSNTEPQEAPWATQAQPHRGRVAVVTGAARGIGGATAKLMAQAGAKVAIGDVLDERGRQTVKDTRNARRRARYAARGPRPITALPVLVSTAEEDWEPFCTCHRSAPCHYCETLTEEEIP